jgi:hypothetical protein
MKAVLISIQPKWCELIASGKKTIEVRKTRPKIETPFKVYVYMTKHKWIFKLLPFLKNRFAKVIGEFVCDDIIVDERGENADVFSKYAQLSLVEQNKYGANKPLFGWHITDLKIYYKPKELWEFSSYGCKIVGDCCINYDCPNCIDNGWMQPPDCKIDGCYLTRPPQSWCYVEELE